MSLSIYLIEPSENSGIRVFDKSTNIFRELTNAEWDKAFPNCMFEEYTYVDDGVFSCNITHNLGAMASAVGIYQHLWRPEEINATKAKDLIAPLEDGSTQLKRDKEHFSKFNPQNGWGDYEDFVKFVESYLQACKNYPEAQIRVF